MLLWGGFDIQGNQLTTLWQVWLHTLSTGQDFARMYNVAAYTANRSLLM